MLKAANMFVGSSFLTVVAITSCLSAPDNEALIVRPCRLDNLECIQGNLAANSHCKTNVPGFIGTTHIPEFRFESPYFHSSYLEKNLIIRNLDSCVVSEFFFNLNTATAVLSVDCFDYNIETDRTVLQHRSLCEDKKYSYHINSTYPIIRLTANLNVADRIDFCNEYTFAEVPVLPIFHIDSKDEPTSEFLTQDLTEIFAFERETFHYRGIYILNHILKKKICDFGCDMC